MLTADPEAEGIAIATLCSDQLPLKVLLLSKIKDEHFGLYATKQIFIRLMALIKNNKEIPSMGVLKVDPALPDESKTYINNLQVAPITDKDDAYALVDVLDKYRQVRCYVEASQRTLEALKLKDPDIEGITKDFEETLTVIRSPAEEDAFVHSGTGDNTDPFIDDIMNGVSPPLVKTGFASFDDTAGGFERTALVILAADSGGGKSAMSLQLGVNMTRLGYSFCLISLEMNKTQVTNRYFSNITQIPYNAIRLRKLSYNQKVKLMEAYKKHKEELIQKKCRFSVVVPTDNHNIPEWQLILKPYGYDVVNFDYINLITDSRDNNNGDIWKMLMHHSWDGKLMAQHCNQCVIMNAQLEASTMNIRYSRAIRENANNLWMWVRDEKARESHLLEIKQGKARDNEDFSFTVLENFECMTLEDVGATRPQNQPKPTGPTPVMPGLDDDEKER